MGGVLEFDAGDMSVKNGIKIKIFYYILQKMVQK
jgi:hypothetical protein